MKEGLMGAVVAGDEWRVRLKREVPVTDIPSYLAELQALVAGLRRWRDNLKVPSEADVAPLLTPLLRRYPGLTVAYLTDARYAAVVRGALGLTTAADEEE